MPMIDPKWSISSSMAKNAEIPIIRMKPIKKVTSINQKSTKAAKVVPSPKTHFMVFFIPQFNAQLESGQLQYDEKYLNGNNEKGLEKKIECKAIGEPKDNSENISDEKNCTDVNREGANRLRSSNEVILR